MRYALIKDGIVENVCEWDGNTATWSPPAGVTAVLASDACGPGWTYDGSSFSPPAAPAKVFNGTTLDFLRLFTPTEVIAFNAQKAAVNAMTPQDYSDPAKAGLAQFSYFLALFLETNTIDASRPDLQAGLDILIALNVIAPNRKAQIIAGEAP